MPELPEVEFARARIEEWLRGRRLARVEVERTRVTRIGPTEFDALSGEKVLAVERTGKWLLWRISGALGVLGHLGMTGKFVLRGPDDEVRWSKVRFVREDGGVVHFQDPRMFGRISAGPLDKVLADPTYSTLGPDAWNAPPTAAKLRSLLAGRKRSLKDALMDQTILAGVGNIQATEALWRAKVHPARPAASLTPQEAGRLVRGIHWSLARTLKLNEGDQEITYVEEAPAENPFVVYGRAGEKCPRCRTVLEKETIGGRTSVFCPKCQPRIARTTSRKKTR